MSLRRMRLHPAVLSMALLGAVGVVFLLVATLVQQERRHASTVAALEGRLLEACVPPAPVEAPQLCNPTAAGPAVTRPEVAALPATVSPEVLDDLLENRRREKLNLEFDLIAERIGTERRSTLNLHLGRLLEEGLDPEAAATIEGLWLKEIDVDLQNRRARFLGDLDEVAYLTDMLAGQTETNQRTAYHLTSEQIDVLRGQFVADDP